jgi:hypothetical protein
VRNAVLRGSLRAQWVRRFVDSGKLAVPAEYGPGPVGRLCPPAERTEPLEYGFSLAEVDGATYLVRPDGYVADVMPADPAGSLRAVLAG